MSFWTCGNTVIRDSSSGNPLQSPDDPCPVIGVFLFRVLYVDYGYNYFPSTDGVWRCPVNSENYAHKGRVSHYKAFPMPVYGKGKNRHIKIKLNEGWFRDAFSPINQTTNFMLIGQEDACINVGLLDTTDKYGRIGVLNFPFPDYTPVYTGTGPAATQCITPMVLDIFPGDAAALDQPNIDWTGKLAAAYLPEAGQVQCDEFGYTFQMNCSWGENVDLGPVPVEGIEQGWLPSDCGYWNTTRTGISFIEASYGYTTDCTNQEGFNFPWIHNNKDTPSFMKSLGGYKDDNGLYHMPTCSELYEKLQERHGEYKAFQAEIIASESTPFDVKNQSMGAYTIKDSPPQNGIGFVGARSEACFSWISSSRLGFGGLGMYGANPGFLCRIIRAIYDLPAGYVPAGGSGKPAGVKSFLNSYYKSVAKQDDPRFAGGIESTNYGAERAPSGEKRKEREFKFEKMYQLGDGRNNNNLAEIVVGWSSAYDEEECENNPGAQAEFYRYAFFTDQCPDYNSQKPPGTDNYSQEFLTYYHRYFVFKDVDDSEE